MTDYLALTEQLERVFTSRLALRPLSLSDSWPLFQATRNPDFNKHLLWEQPENESYVLDRINTTVDAARRGRLAAMSAVLKATGEWVSLYRFQPSSHDPTAVEMGIWTSDKFWNGRFSLELTRACIDAAFSLSDVSSLIGGASPHNAPSCKLLEYCGLVPFSMGIRHSETFVEVLAQEFRITRQQWLEKRLEIAFEQVPFDDIAQPSKVELERSVRNGFSHPALPGAQRPFPPTAHNSVLAPA
jgi:RimJ/RimL family protein N-acetyltransferase